MSRGWSSGLLREEGGPVPTPTHERTHHAVDYLRAPLNHPWWTFIPFLLVVAAATVAAFAIPKRYTTSCLVLVKVSQIPDKILTTVAEDLDARRHQTIRQEILSRTRLERVNDELHPYPDARTVTVALEAMQAATEVNFRGSDAFTIEFTHHDPMVATTVTNRIATLFIDEFRRSRQSQFEGATEFLDTELREARRELDAKEEALRRYKEGHMGRLPEQLPATLSSLQRLQLELQGVEANLDAAEARLERLTSRVAPDVPATPAGLTERESIELELARLRLRYTDEHPDVQEQVARLRSLEDQPPSVKPGGAQEAITTTQLKRAQAELANLEARRETLRKDIATQQAYVEQMPRSEQNLATLTRDFTQLRDNYDGLLRRRMDAQMAVRLQQRWTEDFEILDPARVPERHSFPNQPLFVLVGIILGMGVGFGAALLSEVFSGCVLSLEDLEETVQVPVLAVLPVIDSRDGAAASRYRASRQTEQHGRHS
jgi:polysaccharide chain length determinant protein (PEP-CTERM system associated)